MIKNVLISISCFLIAITAMAERTYTDFKIGVVLPLSTKLAPYGKEVLDGAETSITKFKKNNPQLGKYIKVIAKDNEGSERKTVELSNELIKKTRVSVLLGALTSSNTLSLAKLSSQQKVPLIAPTFSSVSPLKNFPYTTATSNSYEHQSRSAAIFIFNKLQLTRVATIFDLNDANQVNMVNAFESKFKKLGGNQVKKAPFLPGPEELKQTLLEIKSNNPQVIYLPMNLLASSQIILQARLLGMKQRFVGSEKWDNPKVVGQRGIFKGNYFPTSYLKNAPAKKLSEFRASFFAKYNREPSAVAALGYDAMQVILSAYAKSKTSRKEIIYKYLKDFRSADGTLGYVVRSKDKKWIDKPLVFVKVLDSSLKPLTVIEPKL